MENTHALEVGMILVAMWGYDQTNVDWYEVVKVTPATVQIRQIKSKREADAGFMSEHVVPDPGNYIGEPIRRKPLTYTSRPAVAVESYANAYLWDGTPQTANHYA